MHVAHESGNTYRDFDLEQDILYFKVGHRGLVSFHGKNFNVTRRISSEQLLRMVKQSTFLKVNTDCYANLPKIESVSKGTVFFAIDNHASKSIPVTKLRQYALQEMLAARTPSPPH